jgi:hypothetical protein
MLRQRPIPMLKSAILISPNWVVHNVTKFDRINTYASIVSLKVDEFAEGGILIYQGVILNVPARSGTMIGIVERCRRINHVN